MTNPNNPGQGEGHTPITFCHKPGTPAQKELTTDDDGFLQGHLGHGDNLGPCLDTPPPPPTLPDPYTETGEWLLTTLASCENPVQTSTKTDVLHSYTFDEDFNIIETITETSGTTEYHLNADEIAALCATEEPPIVVEPPVAPPPVTPPTIPSTGTTEVPPMELASTGMDDFDPGILILAGLLIAAGVTTFIVDRIKKRNRV